MVEVAVFGPRLGIAGQSRDATYHVALVSLTSRRAEGVIPQVRGLYDGLEEVGYFEGKNLIVHRINGRNETDGREQLRETLRRQINAIVTTSAMETAIAKQLTNTIPIVFAPARNPVRLGFIQSYAHPGSNLTGLSYSRNVDDSAKQLATFKQMVPTLRRVMTLYSPRTTPVETLEAVKRAAAYIKVELAIVPVMSQIDAEQAVRHNSNLRPDAVFLICSAAFREFKTLTDITARQRLPVFGCTSQHVAEEGAVMTYTPDIYFLGYRGAWYVDRIFRGAKPQDLPVEVPDRFETVVNLRTAKSLGVKLHPEKLILADKIFQ